MKGKIRSIILLSVAVISMQKFTAQVNTFTATNAQISDTLISGGIIKAQCIRANDTVVANGEVHANDNLRVSGNLFLNGNLVLDATNDIGFKLIQASSNTSSTSIISFGKTVGNSIPWVQECPLPAIMPSPWIATSGGFISHHKSTTSLVDAGLKLYTAPWNGFGHIELEGVNEAGMGNNALEINYYCGRNTHINRNSSLTNGGGWVRMGNQVSMDKHVEIGDPQYGINDPNNTALQIHANAGKGLVVRTYNGTLKAISLEFGGSMPYASPFTVYGNGKTVIGNQQVVGTHADALLQVAGKAASKSFYVLKPTTWQDRVFTNEYTLLPLKEVEAYVNTHKHLPNIESEKEILEKGYDINEMDAKLLEKIENLYLYIIKQEKEIEKLKTEINQLKK
jgi:hypothetical protein